VLSSDLYDAYGNLLSGGDSSDPYGYNGQAGYYTDHETGLILCTHRYYDPTVGRWINRNPIGYDGGINLYGYCWNGPIDGEDYYGYKGSGWFHRHIVVPAKAVDRIFYRVFIENKQKR
jgi:RHS repeat-associated protein